MDFNGIKKMLLACFVVFNIYLLTVWFNERPSVTSSSGSTITIQQQLGERGIHLANPNFMTVGENIPLLKAKKESKIQTSQNAVFSNMEGDQKEYVKHTFSQPLSLGIELPSDEVDISDETLKKIHEEFLDQDKYILNGKTYQYARYSPFDRTLNFYQLAPNGLPIVDGTAEVRIILNDSLQVLEYTQTSKASFEELSEFSTLLSAEKALQILDQRVETYLPNDSTILSVELAYGRLHDLSEIDIYTPVWEIVYERQDGSVRSKMVDAIRGTVVTIQHFYDKK